ncbi:MAG: hypothetical protein H6609_20270 [Ignavibacteriales bacterium]|nr:hypothetical protein [Ignavibacteriales bacterium]
MKKTLRYISLVLISGLFLFFLLKKNNNNIENESGDQILLSSSKEKMEIENKKERDEYFYKILRDPATNKIPKNIRQRELLFAGELEKKNQSLQKNSGINELTWKEAGPFDVGGRTRALAIDINNKNTIIAGSAGGGIWKSTDNGATWQIKSTTSQILSVTSIAQDKRPGNTSTWYYASGEFDGSNQDLGWTTGRFSGGGIYKSVLIMEKLGALLA